MRVLSLFSGIGAFEAALDRVGVDYEVVNFCEIDKHAASAYAQVHGVDPAKNLVDVTKVDTAAVGHVDLVTYDFPCQDISVEGKGLGFTDEEGNRTRSGLFFEALRIIKDTQPAIAIAENVKALTSKRFASEFNIVLGSLSAAGYNNYYKVLNARDFGIPQNRERVFIVSIRKDLDSGAFTFPEGRPLELRLKDMLEESVAETYYVGASKSAASLISVGEQCLRVKENTQKGYAEAREGDSINLSFPTSKTRRGRVGAGVAQTLMAGNGEQCVVVSGLRIRKLTPRERWRLMGFTDDDFNRVKGISDAQLYKQAGNSIVVNVLEALYRELFKAVDIKAPAEFFLVG